MDIESACETAIRSLNAAGHKGFITCETNHPKVVVKFKTLREAQVFHRALILCGEAARMIEKQQPETPDIMQMLPPPNDVDF